MDSPELYHTKQKFILGAYYSIVKNLSPDPSSPDYLPTLLYKIRSCIALNDPASALTLLSQLSGETTQNRAAQAASALARYVQAQDQERDAGKAEAALEELRDLCVEMEGEGEEGERDKALVKVLAATAFARAGEVEEALETLGADTEDLEAVALTVQIYLSLHRPDLARKAYDLAKRWAEDDLLLQLIESMISVVTGKDGYSACEEFYSEQLRNPAFAKDGEGRGLLTARGVVRLLKGEASGARSDLEEVLGAGKGADETNGEEGEGGKGNMEAKAAMVVAAGLAPAKKGEADELWSRFITMYPTHPIVADVAKKAELFDECAAKFEVPPSAVPVRS